MAEKSLNRVTLLGRIGADPDIKYPGSQQAQAFCTLSIATNQVWKDEYGNVQQKADWHRVVIWGKMAETCYQYLKKGDRIYVEGSQHTREYNDKDGVKRFITEVRMNNMVMLNSSNSTSNTGYNPAPKVQSSKEIAEKLFHGGQEPVDKWTPDQPEPNVQANIDDLPF
jgi:single-strand DNA-binding protein